MGRRRRGRKCQQVERYMKEGREGKGYVGRERMRKKDAQVGK